MIVSAPCEKYPDGIGPWRTAIVFLDMVRLDCISADDVAGTVIAAKLPLKLDDSGENLAEVTLRGKVTIITQP